MSQAPYSDLAQQQLETALKVARITLDGAEKLIHLQLESAKQAVEDSAKNAARLAEVKDVQSAMAVRGELAEHAASTLLGLSRDIYELAAQAQGELTRLAEEQVQAGQKAMLSGFDNFSKSAPAGTDVFSSALKTNFAASQAAFESLNKAAKQVTEFADASIRAASTATSQAAKGTTRRR